MPNTFWPARGAALPHFAPVTPVFAHVFNRYRLFCLCTRTFPSKVELTNIQANSGPRARPENPLAPGALAAE